MADRVYKMLFGSDDCVEGICKHNRWHPDIAPALRINPGDIVEMQTRDASDGQIRDSMTVADLADYRGGRVHPLTGPIYIEGAQPGDLLEVTIMNIVADDHAFTATFPGRGFMPDLFPDPILVHWDIEHGWATSRQIPGVRIPGAPFMGTIGVAPSLDRLRSVNERERRAQEAGASVMLPMTTDALPADPAIANEAWRTIAAHEVGGNMDIRQLVVGAKVYFPVDIPGALFSVGDAHFCQGDGETCGTAVEMGAHFTARFDLLKDEARARRQSNPTFTTCVDSGSLMASAGYFGTTALSVSDGVVSPMNASLAARNAVGMMIDFLVHEYDLSREQAYILASVAGDLSISSIVNWPHAQVSMLMPRAIFQ